MQEIFCGNKIWITLRFLASSDARRLYLVLAKLPRTMTYRVWYPSFHLVLRLYKISRTGWHELVLRRSPLIFFLKYLFVSHCAHKNHHLKHCNNLTICPINMNSIVYNFCKRAAEGHIDVHALIPKRAVEFYILNSLVKALRLTYTSVSSARDS